MADDFVNNNHLVSTLVDSAQPMAGKKAILQTRLLAGISLRADG